MLYRAEATCHGSRHSVKHSFNYLEDFYRNQLRVFDTGRAHIHHEEIERELTSNNGSRDDVLPLVEIQGKDI